MLVLPFNIYGWIVPGNTSNYVTSPYYLWLRVPMQMLFIAFAYFGTREDKRWLHPPPDGQIEMVNHDRSTPRRGSVPRSLTRASDRI
jgi:hypothetical protein